MMSLKQHHPDVYTGFLKGKFAVKKSKRVFSAIVIEQANEQNNASVKGDSGAVSLTKNHAALHRWMVCVVQRWLVCSRNSREQPRRAKALIDVTMNSKKKSAGFIPEE